MFKNIKYIIPQTDSSVSSPSQADTSTYYITDSDYFIKHIFNPFFNTGYTKKIISEDTLKKKNIFNKTTNPGAVKICIEKPSLKYIPNNYCFYKESKDWIIILVLLVLFIISWLRLVYYKSMQQILKSGYNFQLSQKYYRERNTIFIRVSSILNVLFIINLSLFMYFTLNYLNIHLFRFSGLLYYLLCCGILSFVYILKYLIYKSLGWLLLFQRSFSEYLYNFFIYEKILGVLILPVVIGIPFMPVFFLPVLIKTGLGLILLCLIIRTIRGVNLSFKLNVSILYIFLYLCTLEILPLLIFLKILILNR